MDENNRVKNIKEKFEVLNIKSEPVTVSNKHNANVSNAFITNNDNVFLSSKFSDHLIHEKHINPTTNIYVHHSRGSNIKRTPAFRRDKCVSKFNSSSLAVNKQCTNVGDRIKQFDNFSSSDFTSFYRKDNSNSEEKIVDCLNNKEVEMIIDNSRINKLIHTTVNNEMIEKNSVNTDEDTSNKRYGVVLLNGRILKENPNNNAIKEIITMHESADRSYSDETLKKILQAPLPSGPPPRKPPRVFFKEKRTTVCKEEKCDQSQSPSFGDRLKKNVNFNGSSACNTVNNDNDEKQGSVKPGKSKNGLEVILNKLEIASKGCISEKGSCIESNNSPNNFWKSNDNAIQLQSFKKLKNSIVQNDKMEENIYAEPIIIRNFCVNSPKKNTFDEHIYEELDKKLCSDVCRNENEEERKLYYMSSPVSSLSSSFKTLEDWNVCATSENDKSKDYTTTTNTSFENKRIRDWINEVYAKPWSKWSDDGSDSDSAISLTEDVPAHIVTDIISDDFHEQLTQERKGYVRRVATRAVTRGHNLETTSADYKHIFECIILVGLDMDPTQTKVPYIKMKFPPDANIPQRVEYLCFPDTHKWPIACSAVSSTDVIEQCYTIILTTQSGQRKYGYCRRVLPEGATKPLPLAYCILSPHKAGQFYFSILEELESRHGQTEQEFTNFIQNLYDNELPARGRGIKITADLLPDFQSSADILEIFKRPLDNRLEDLQLSKTLSFLRLNIFLQIFSTLLIERKVILLSSSVSKLSTCVDGLQTALLPFNWQHTLISIVPSSVISVTDLCQAPTPYFIGLLKSCNVSEEDDVKLLLPSFGTVHEVVIVDIDENKVLRKVGDENSILPYRLLKSLKSSLDNAHSTSAEINTYNLLACETFMRLFVELIGHYRHYIIVSEHAKKKIFQKEAFIRGAKSRTIRLFLEWFSETAMFTSFIESRLQVGPDSRGLFEQRCNEFHEEIDKLKQQKYKQSNKTIIKQLGDRIKDFASV